ncbi:MAG: D-isomer specific 2-hydroxyacid dehydrogenase NAD-binding protein [Parcubacteria bacterium 33_209]|nr:MAG: D-isomer specific 2-hydroxyacid dehydrogenase NAD-binding protein [Parcubacteria bacterium 33_209]
MLNSFFGKGLNFNMVEIAKKWKIFVTDSDSESVDIETEKAKEINASVIRVNNCTTEEEVVEYGSSCDALIVDYAPITERVINNLKNCKVIVRCGIGLDNIDISAATRRGIYIVNLSTFCIDEVSTHAVALTLALVKKLFQFTQDVQSGFWDFKRRLPIVDLKESKIGVIGFGNIARLFIQKTKVFGAKHLVHDPYINPKIIEESGAKPVSFEEILSNSDIISIHIPLTNETEYLFGESEFKKMKKTAYIINTSRGKIINEKALYQALKEDWIAGAGLDTLNQEPPLKDNPLFKLDNVIITPHCAYYSETALRNSHAWAIQAVIDVYKNKMPNNLINKELWHKK